MNLSSRSQELELQIFLEAAGVEFPLEGRPIGAGYFVTDLGEMAAKVFAARDGRVILLSYEIDRQLYPISCFFLSQDAIPKFGFSRMLLDSYDDDPSPLEKLTEATQKFFLLPPEILLAALCEDWKDVELSGGIDKRILWERPNESLAKIFGESSKDFPALPIFPSVYSFNNPYLEELLKVLKPRIQTSSRVLIMGAGAGFEAAMLALHFQMMIDATDIHPIAVANTRAIAERLSAGHLVKAWASDGFQNIFGEYDLIVFNAPLVAEEKRDADENRFDQGGKILTSMLRELPKHLTENGKLLLMSRPDLSKYWMAGLNIQLVHPFEIEKIPLGISEISLAPSMTSEVSLQSIDARDPSLRSG